MQTEVHGMSFAQYALQMAWQHIVIRTDSDAVSVAYPVWQSARAAFPGSRPGSSVTIPPTVTVRLVASAIRANATTAIMTQLDRFMFSPL